MKLTGMQVKRPKKLRNQSNSGTIDKRGNPDSKPDAIKKTHIDIPLPKTIQKTIFKLLGIVLNITFFPC